MAATLKTVEGGRVTSMDDAAVRWALSNQNGIIQGCETTLSGNTVTVQSGRIMIYGRLVDITLTEIAIPYTTTTQQGAVYVEIQPENAQQPAQIGVMSAEGSVNLTQEDLMNGGSTYQFPLATFTVNANEVRDFAESLQIYVPIGDFVMSNTIENGWRVRKWNSGFCEMWLNTTITGMSITAAAGSLYYTATAAYVDLPFTTTSDVFAQITAANAATGVNQEQSKTTQSKLAMRFDYPLSQTNTSRSVRIYAISTWK